MKLKYQQGGTFVPPFAVYQPFILPTAEEQSSSNASKKSSSDGIDMGDVYKLLDDLKGLPGDVGAAQSTLVQLFSNIEQKLTNSSVFGGTSSIASEYMQLVNLIGNIKFQRQQYDEAQKTAVQKGSIHEAAIDKHGRVMVQSENGFDWISPEEYHKNKDNYHVVTNAELLDYRAQGVGGLAFDTASLASVNDAMGINEVTKLITDIIDKLGKDYNTQEGFVQSKQLIRGLQDFIAAKEKTGNYDATVNDLYSGKIITESQAKQAMAALNYIYQKLPSSAITLLKMKSNGTAEGAKAMIDSLVTSRLSSKMELSGLKLEAGPTAKTTSSSKDTTDDSNPYLQYIRQQGGIQKNFTVITKSGNIGTSVEGRFYPTIDKVDKQMSIEQLLSTGLQGITYNAKNGIVFGDQIVNPNNLKDIMFDNEGAMVVSLPAITDQLGNKIVFADVLDEYKKVEAELAKYRHLSKEEQEKKKIELFKKEGLDFLVGDDGNVDYSKFALFMVVGAYTTEKSRLSKYDSEYIQKIQKPDEELEKMLSQGLSSEDNEYSVDIQNWWEYWGYDNVYKANVYIPLNINPNSAVNAYGDQRSEASVDATEKQYQDFNKLMNMKSTK